MSGSGEPGLPAHWSDVAAQATEQLVAAGWDPDRARLEVRRIGEHATGSSPAEWVLLSGDGPTQRTLARFDACLARRLAGEPLQYVLGSWGFRTLEVFCDPRALIPRPETEVVVGAALEALAGLPRPAVAVDLGTGTGVIACCLAVEGPPDTEIWATDLSADALEVAAANLAGIGRPAARVRLAQGSWFDALPDSLAGRVGLVVTNPPYVSEAELVDLPVEVRRYEPVSALVAGPEGTEALASILSSLGDWLMPGGVVVCEIGAGQGAAVADLARGAGLVDVAVVADLAGRDRVLVARRGE